MVSLKSALVQWRDEAYMLANKNRSSVCTAITDREKRNIWVPDLFVYDSLSEAQKAVIESFMNFFILSYTRRMRYRRNV